MGGTAAHLANISTNLAHSSKELNPLHPFVLAEARLSSEIMQVLDHSVQNIFQSGVLAL